MDATPFTRRSLILASTLAAAPAVSAQEGAASISGIVADDRGRPVPGAKVYLSDLGEYRTSEAAADANGRYAFRGLAPRRYFIVAMAPAHRRFDKFGVELPAGKALSFDITLPRAIPDGFTSIFNGADLSGWHISKTCVHGSDPDFRIIGGALVGTQRPFLRGGLVLTDRKYRDFEVYVETWPDFGCDSGLFLRSSEAGQAYQVKIDYLKGGDVGGVYGEGLRGVRGVNAADWEKAWKREDWNSLRARIERATPHIRVWINDVQVTDWTDTANHAANGGAEGHIGLQVHMLERWKDGGFHRFRNMAVKEL